MSTAAKLIRRHDRIRAVWQRTASANTAERCRLRMASIAREARENFDAAHARAVGDFMVLRLPDDRARASPLENIASETRGPLAPNAESGQSPRCL